MQGPIFDFPPFRADAARRSLVRGGREVALSRKAFDTLIVLLEQPGEVISKDDLMKRVWPDSFVEENSLNQSISAIRKALGDPKLIETIPGRGYRFTAPIQAPAQLTPRSLAVLPLRAFASEDDALGIGIADTLITRLGNIRELTVRPTSAVLRYAARDRDPVDAGRTLGVDSVLDAGIRRAGERLRVNAQLVSVERGATIWAGTFDERFTDIFAVEDSISQRVAEALTTQLSGEERNRLVHRGTENSEAYRLCLNGRWYADRLTRDGLMQSVRSLERAVEIDPDYALAYSGLSHQFIQCADLTLPSSIALDLSEKNALRALDLDPANTDARVSLGVVRWYRDRDREGSIEEFEQALATEPRNAYAHNFFGWILVLMGDVERGLAEVEHALDLDPHSPANAMYRVPSLYVARRYDEALARGREAIANDPDHWLIHTIVGRTHEAMGDLTAALACYERAREIDPSILESLADVGRVAARLGDTARAREILETLANEPVFLRAWVLHGLGETDAARAALRQCIAERSWYQAFINVDPTLDGVRV